MKQKNVIENESNNKYQDINKKALNHFDKIISCLKLVGEHRGKEYVAFNPKRDDNNLGSFNINTENGIWCDFAESNAKGGDIVSLVAYLNDLSQSQAFDLLFQALNEPVISEEKSVAAVVDETTQHKNVNSDRQIFPVPSNAIPLPKYIGGNLGNPSNIYRYLNAAGDLLGYILRFDLKNGKTIRPATLCLDDKGSYVWKLRGFPTPRPIYNLHELALKPNAKVLIVEGEKSAEAAKKLYPDFVVTTLMHGAESVDTADLSPLYGKNVQIWADNDEAGRRYANNIANALSLVKPVGNIQILDVFHQKPDFTVKNIVRLATGFSPSQGWDAANALEEGWTSEHIALLDKSMYKDFKPNKSTYMVENFEVSDKGVYDIKIVDGKEFKNKICSRLDVTGLARDTHSASWGIVLEFKDKDDQLHKWCMPSSMLADSKIYRSQLLSMGLDIMPGFEKQLSAYLQHCNPIERVLSVNQPGWHNNVYVLPKSIIGISNETVMIQTDDPVGSDIYKQKATLNDWQENVAKYCVGNSRLILSICAALTGPWLWILGEESGGVHFVGASSSGKTTAAQVAASVWGSPSFVRSWRTTDNALESIASRHNDNLLILDEMSQVGPEKAGEIAYMLGNGQGKGRATKSAGIQKSHVWRLIYLSTGEVSLADHMSNANRRTMAGQEVRLVNLPSDAGQNMGLFEQIHTAENPQAFSTLMKRNTKDNYGAAGVAMLECMMAENSEELKAKIRNTIQVFVNTCVPVGSDGQVSRVAQRFGLFAAVGEYAISQGILPWSVGDAVNGVNTCFNAWIEQRGGVGSHETTNAIAQVRRFIELNGESRFTLWAERHSTYPSDRPTMNRAGFRRATADGRTEYYVLPEVWKNEICTGIGAAQVTKAMREAGFLNDHGNSATQSVRLNDLGTQRVYIVKADLMGAADE